MKRNLLKIKFLPVVIMSILVCISLAGCALKPAPITAEAEQKLVNTQKKITNPPSAPGATKEEHFIEFITNMKTLFKESGYDLDKTIEQVAADYDKIVAEKKEANFVVMSVLTIARGCSVMKIDIDKLFPKSSVDALNALKVKMVSATPVAPEKK